MSRASNRFIAVAVTSLIAWAGCIVGQDNATDDVCDADSDCPSGYLCGAERRGGRFCELVFPVRASVPDAGAPDAGPRVFYCSQTQSGSPSVKSLMDNYCVACHGAVFPQLNVRLDVYDTLTGNGVKPRGDRVKYRMGLIKDMPTLDAGTFPTETERALVVAWVDQGAQFCDVDLDAGAGGGAGGGVGGGTGGGGGGGGVPDSGTPDAGQPVKYSTQIQPIWNNYCTGCHAGGSASGGLDLSAANSYNELISTQGCNATTKLVYTDGRAETGHMLWRKLDSAATGRCGTVMPQSGALSTFDTNAMNLIKRWLLEGAKNL